jgi:periplasmic divalent cation tolerance protein
MQEPDTPMLVYVTVPDAAEAAAIGRVLVTERLAACANVLGPARSIYRWQGEICDESEHVLVAKTTRSRLEALTERVVALHSASLPCVVALPITGGNGPFLDWIGSETRRDES